MLFRSSGAATPVGTDVLADLAPNLTEESLGVLRWTWGDRQEPFTVGDLRRALSEIRHNRIGKIAMVAEQAQILDGSASPPTRDPRGRRYVGVRRDRPVAGVAAGTQ